MILLLLNYLHDQLAWKIPAVFFYSSTRMLFATITTLLLTILLGPRFIQKLYSLKTGQPIRVEDCPVLAELHKKKKNTPTMGGVLILFSMLSALLLWMDLKNVFTLILFVSTLWLGLIGMRDDYLKIKHKTPKGMSGKRKFFLQCVLAGLVALYLLMPAFSEMISFGDWFQPPFAEEFSNQMLSTQSYISRYYVPFYKQPIFVLSGAGLIFGFFFTMFVVTGSSNAVNLTDGLDGLAAGCVIFVASVLAVFAFLSSHLAIARYLNLLYIEGSSEIGVYLCAMMGACLGFLWYNGHPAQVFMGDTGSLALGGLLGICAVLLRRELLLALAGGIFVVEALSVIIQVVSFRCRNRKRVFLCAPIHHHFEYKGWSETKVVIRFWIIALILALISLTSIKMQ